MVSRMNGSSPRETEPVIVLRRDKLDELRRASDIGSEAELARLIGVSPATLWRITRGEVVPSQGFIARTLLAFPSASFALLFRVEQRMKVA